MTKTKKPRQVSVLKKYTVKSVDCVLTKERWVNLEYFLVNNYDQGSIEMSFIMDDNLSTELSGKTVKCKFNTYVLMKSIDEFYDANDVECSNISKEKEENIQGKFGPIVVYEESPWIDKGGRILDFDEPLPKHYLFITSDDIIEIISHDKPVFTVLDKAEEISISINRVDEE